jgi:hypothetical protein
LSVLVITAPLFDFDVPHLPEQSNTPKVAAIGVFRKMAINFLTIVVFIFIFQRQYPER